MDRHILDEEVARRLPLPLAQLYRRAFNAKAPLERHQAAYYLWEAALKLLASVAVVEYAEEGGACRAEPAAERALRNLARPSLGHWWEILRLLMPLLSRSGPSAWVALEDLVLGGAREDLARSAGLDAALRDALGEGAGARSAVRPSGLIERIIRYRNRELGHGAAGQRPADFYARLGWALLLGFSELFGRLDVLAGGRLIYLAEVRRLPAGGWLAERFELRGESERRLEPLEFADGEAASFIRPQRLYLERSPRSGGPGAPKDGAFLRSLHPLLLYQQETGEFFSLNARRGKRRVEYLSYQSGRVLPVDEDLGQDHRRLLASVLGREVDSSSIGQWAVESQAEESPAGAAEEDLEPAGGAGQLGDFRLLSVLGRGGMGIVYRAWQPTLGRQVALKCLAGSSDANADVRFRREIRALGRVEHPNLVKIFTSGADGEQWFYAMELIEGADLSSICEHLGAASASEVSEAEWKKALSQACEAARSKEKPISAGAGAPLQARPPGRSEAPDAASAGRDEAPRPGRSHVALSVDVLRQAAEAAHALHEAGVVHRDIKPGNILLTADGSHAVLMDLGLALLSDDAGGQLTATRQFVGTLRYASPEQLLSAGSLDRRSDVYSLGATLWELLTLKPLFGAGEGISTPELMFRIQSADPGRPRRHNPLVPRDLEAIVLKCLEKDRSRRYPTAGELADDLRRWQRNEPVSAQAPTLGYVLGKYARRHRLAIGAAAAILLLGLLGAATAFLRLERAHRETRAALLHLYTARGLQASRDGSDADALLWLARARELAAGDASSEQASRLRVQNWSRGAARPVRAFAHAGQRPKKLVFHPQGEHLLVVTEEGDCAVWDIAREERLSRASGMGPMSAAAWSPGGGILALATPEGEVLVAGFPAGEERERLELPGPAAALAFSPDGRLLALAGSGVGIRVLESRRHAGPELPHPGLVVHVDFDETSSRLLTACEDGLARVFQLDREGAPVSLEPLLSVEHRRDESRGQSWPVFFAGGSLLLALSSDYEITAWDLERRMVERRISADAGFFSLPTPAPGGSCFAIGGWNAKLFQWPSAHPAMLSPQPLATGVVALAFRPDGRKLATAHEEQIVRIWAMPGGKPAPPPGPIASLEGTLPHQEQVSLLAYDPMGRHLATAQRDGLVRLWALDLQQAAERRVWDKGLAATSPDGRFLLTAGKTPYSTALEAQVLEVQSAAPAAERLPAGGLLTGGCFSPDGESAVVLSTTTRRTAERRHRTYRAHETPGRIQLWAWRSGWELFEAVATDSEPLDATFHPQGAVLYVLCAGGELLAVDVAGGRVVQRLGDGSRMEAGELPLKRMLLCAPDGRTLVSWGLGGGARVRDTSNLSLRHVLGESRASDVAVSPDGRLLAVAERSGRVGIHDLESGRAAVPDLMHPGEVGEVRFDASGERLLTACRDSMARVWDWRRGSLAGPPLEHTAGVSTVSFVGGEWVLTTSVDGWLQLWEWRTAQTVAPRLPIYFDSPLGHQSFVTPGRSQGVVCDSNEFVFLCFEGLLASSRQALVEGDLRSLAEVVSGKRLHESAAAKTVTLTSGEWLDRWSALRAGRAELCRWRHGIEEQRAWLERQAIECAAAWDFDGERWHLERLEALGAAVDRRRFEDAEEFVRAWRFAPRARRWSDFEAFEALGEEQRESVEREALSAPLVRSPGPYIGFIPQYSRERTHQAVGYAARRIECEQPRRVRLHAGSDDALRLWLDGRLILEVLEVRPPVPDQNSALLELAAGGNRLLVELCQAWSYWGMYIRLEDAMTGEPLRLRDDDRLEPLRTARTR
jgi:serine/threonine protein kinase/WD40 repeat protein